MELEINVKEMKIDPEKKEIIFVFENDAEMDNFIFLMGALASNRATVRGSLALKEKDNK